SLVNNTCLNNNYVGIILDYSYSTSFVNNTCLTNNHGIYLYFSDDNSFIGNLLINNFEYGIYLESSDYNVLYHNIFFENNAGNVQAFDDGLDNQWYNVSLEEGNFWSDYDGSGSYAIGGAAGAFDLYPSYPDYPYESESLSSESSIYFPISALFSALAIIVCSRKSSKKRDI
ncbi:MAG: right-handed parallel beta-helix repeat-containing protein, partial [Candidatus Heimdallarchaeota archaeon]|nr:right-handed parallel beta-helix repeat-containing protein [Candidatus Heimdallarchaeota archaeon]MCK5049380.1 right-handed parallel beta-helix repeat-containing protein [Candidatus Heimdallarchaeota archaeon]